MPLPSSFVVTDLEDKEQSSIGLDPVETRQLELENEAMLEHLLGFENETQ
jgi:hypothetical protein